MSTLISDKFAAYQAECEARFLQLKANEEELNRIFIDIYGLQDELTPEVADKDITVHRVYRTKDDVPESMRGSNYVRTLRDEIVSLISYAVGCMFGRYSLDVDGLAYAGGEFSEQWVVVSGQYYLKKVVEDLVRQELQGIDRLAEGYGFGDGSVLPGAIPADGGAVCPVGSNTAGGSVDSFQHCRGTGTKLYEGIRKLPVHSQGANAELETQLMICVRLKYLTQSQVDPVMSLSQEVGKMLNALIGKLSTAHWPLTTSAPIRIISSPSATMTILRTTFSAASSSS